MKKLLFGKTTIILVFILLFSAFLRFFHLSTNPPGIMPDEAQFAYYAYSILETGQTPFGGINYLSFREFLGGVFSPVYSYILIPFIKIFGMSIFTERMPSALFGVFASLLLYFLIKQLFGSRKTACIGALLFAINPWALFYSHQGRFEMMSIFFVLLGMNAFFYGLVAKKRWYFVLSALVLGISLHAGNATKIVVPLLSVALILYDWKNTKKQRKHIRIFALVVLAFLLLVVQAMFGDGQIGNYQRSALIRRSEIERQVNYEREHSLAPLWASSIFHNKATVVFNTYVAEFSQVFSVNWLFINGHGNLQESLGRHGQYLLFEIPFFFIGLYLSFQKKRNGLFLLAWLFAGNIPGAITSGHFYPYRSILFLPVPIIYSALGITWFIEYVKRLGKIKYIVLGGFMLFSSIILASFLFTFYYDYPAYVSEWRYKEQTEMLAYAVGQKDTYEHIFVDANYAFIYAFMTTFPPVEFRNAVKREETYRDVPVTVLGKYVFGVFPIDKIATPSAYFPKKSLVITNGGKIPKNIPLVKEFEGAEPLHIVYAAYEVE